MEEVLEKYNLSNLKQRERRNLNSIIFVKEMHFKKIPQSKLPTQIASLVNPFKYLRNNATFNINNQINK